MKRWSRLWLLIWKLLLLGMISVERCSATSREDGASASSEIHNVASMHRGSWSWLVALMSDISDDVSLDDSDSSHESPDGAFVSPDVVHEVSSTHQHFCGGSLINQRWVLTAAHCFDRQAGGSNPSTWKVRFSDNGFQPHQLSSGARNVGGPFGLKSRALGVTHIVRHPRYNRKDIIADIALVHLAGPVSMLSSTHRIATAPLPVHENTTFAVGTRCATVGWKCPAAIKHHASCTAYVVPMPLNDPEQMCSVYSVRDWDNRLCAGKRNADNGVCQGDSGDPLLCENQHGEMVLAGLLSFVHKKTPFAIPSGYTAVTPFLKWIQKTIPLF